MPDPPFLEVDCALLTVFRIRDDDMRLTAVVGDRQQGDTRLPAIAQGLGHSRQRVPRAQHLAANQVCGDVAVAQTEPIGFGTVRRKFLLGVPGLSRMTPSTLGVDAAAEGVHAGVQVGADAQAVHPHVVTDIDDSGDPRGGRVVLLRPVGAEESAYALQESSPTDSANQYSHVHEAKPRRCSEEAIGRFPAISSAK